MMKTPFHEGEIAVQEREGERESASRLGGMIRDALSPPVSALLAAQRTVAVGALDARDRPWASLWLGEPGFVSATAADRVIVSAARHHRSSGDPVLPLLSAGSRVGLLAIDLATRRRLRVNGSVESTGPDIAVAVEEVFPNCPKYIQRREVFPAPGIADSATTATGTTLDAERRALIASVDTLFVASRHPTRGVDVSHRGGPPGFVRVLDDRTLRFPDYQGNGMFQTMGNFEIEPRAGVVFVDFETGRMLAVTGTVATSFGAEITGHVTGGTGRYWTLGIEAWALYTFPSGVGFRFVDASPFHPAT